MSSCDNVTPHPGAALVELEVGAETFNQAEEQRTSGNGSDSSTEFSILTTEREGNLLNIEVLYSGGCEGHSFKIFWSGTSSGDDPCLAQLIISHDGNNDNCEASVSEVLKIDLVDLFGEDGADDLACRIDVYSILNNSNTPDGSIDSN